MKSEPIITKDKRRYGTLYCIGIVLMIAGVIGHIVNYAINGIHGFTTFVTSDQLAAARGDFWVPTDSLKYYVDGGPKTWVEISPIAYHTTYVTIYIYLLGVVCFIIGKKKEILKAKFKGLINKFK